MMGGISNGYLSLLSFLSFAFSVIAAVLAIDMYRLLRTAEFGKTWRLLIIASVMFALAQVLRLAEQRNWTVLRGYGLSEIVELMFVISLAYTFYLQRSSYTPAAHPRQSGDRRVEGRRASDVDTEVAREQEWSRLSGYYAEGADDEAAGDEAADDEPESALRDDASKEWGNRSDAVSPRSRPSRLPSIAREPPR